MLAFNQSKHPLSWSLSGQVFKCEAWASVDIPDEVWGACVRLGLPLELSPVPPEHRAKVVVEDERKASDESVLLALKDRAEAAEALVRTVKEEIERTKVELSEARDDARKARAETKRIAAELERAQADKKTAEQMLDAEAKRATDAEAKLIKAEVHADKSKAKRAAAG